MSTTIQNNQPLQHIDLSENLELNESKLSPQEVPAEWLPTESVSAVSNNRLAQQLMQELAPPVMETIDAHIFDSAMTVIQKSESGSFNITTAVDTNDDGEYDEYLWSGFSEDGELLVKRHMREDLFEVHNYNSDGELAHYQAYKDLDLDGHKEIFERLSDTDNNGKIDTFLTYELGGNGPVSASKYTDVNEDGIMDYVIHQTMDERGQQTDYKAEVLEGGIFDPNAEQAQLTIDDILEDSGGIFADSSEPDGVLLDVDLAHVQHAVVKEGSGLAVFTQIDKNGDDIVEGSYLSTIDSNGNLSSKGSFLDTNGDGIQDNSVIEHYDEDGNLTVRSERLDSDKNGIYEKIAFDKDTDGNGLVDTKETSLFDNEDGYLTGMNIAVDVNEDGVMDIGLNRTYDANRNQTSQETVYFDDGLYADSTDRPDWETLFGEPESPVSPIPSGGGNDDLPPIDFGGPELPTFESPVIGDTKTDNPTAAAQFVSENAGYNNVLFTYDVDEQNKVSNIRQIMGNSNEMSAGQAMGDVALSNGQPNLLLLPNGANEINENTQLTIMDGTLHIDGQPYDDEAYFSHSAAMSTDGEQHFQFSTGQDGHAIVKMEDLPGLGDRDFNDLEIKVLNGDAQSVAQGLQPVTMTPKLANLSAGFQVPDLLIDP